MYLLDIHQALDFLCHVRNVKIFQIPVGAPEGTDSVLLSDHMTIMASSDPTFPVNGGFSSLL